MEDKELKKKLAKVPDADEKGEPIFKIDGSAEREGQQRRSKVPLFLKKNPSAAQGNAQDEKDETPE
jgi:hypothetical protein